jgi:hypothetical protein
MFRKIYQSLPPLSNLKKETSEKGGFSLLRIFFSTALWTRSAEKSQIFRALRFAKRCYRKKYIRAQSPLLTFSEISKNLNRRAFEG